MLLVWLGWWGALIAVLAGMRYFADDSIIAVSVVVAIILGILGPLALSYWRPLFLRWAQRAKTLREDLLAKGLLAPKEAQRDLRFIHLTELTPQSLRKKRRGMDGFLLLAGRELHIITAAGRLHSDRFSLLERQTPLCRRCWVIWACGGEGFRLRLANGDGAERVFLIQSREGRSLLACAHNTEMLAEVVEIEAHAAEDGKTAEDALGRSANEEKNGLSA